MVNEKKIPNWITKTLNIVIEPFEECEGPLVSVSCLLSVVNYRTCCLQNENWIVIFEIFRLKFCWSLFDAVVKFKIQVSRITEVKFVTNIENILRLIIFDVDAKRPCAAVLQWVRRENPTAHTAITSSLREHEYISSPWLSKIPRWTLDILRGIKDTRSNNIPSFCKSKYVCICRH